MLQGLAQLIFFAETWWRRSGGTASCWEWSRTSSGSGRTAAWLYMEFRVGDYQHEFGLIDSRYAPHATAGAPAGSIANWQVDDVTAALEKLLSMGAAEHEPRIDRGDSGWVTASVVDPFGNILGITYNPHYVEIRKRVGAFELPEVEPDLPPESR
jgi:predicted enzyme related to lactoylglutathione lyase